MRYISSQGVLKERNNLLMIAVAVSFALSMTMSVFSFAGATSHTDCTFTTSGATMRLDGDCITEETLLIPDGMTLNGSGHTITAVDPDLGHFTGAVVSNEGAEANVTNITITADSLSNVCDGGADRLRGIMFEGASGSITNAEVVGINQGLSGCQEGNAIEVRNAPFDGSHPNTQDVLVKGNNVSDWQKGGIVCNGDVSCTIQNNKVDASASDKYFLAPNSIQVAFGAHGVVERNNVVGSSWCGPSAFVGTAMLLFEHEDGTVVRQNNIRGDSDVAIYNLGGMTTIDNNKVFEDRNAENCNVNFPDSWGIGNWGADSEVTNNKVRGFATNYDGVTGGKNKAIPGSNGPNSMSLYW